MKDLCSGYFMKHSLILAMSLIFFQGQLQSFFGSISKYEKNDKQIWFLGDYHGQNYYNFEADIRHKNLRHALFSNFNSSNCKVIVEDMGGYCGSHVGLKKFQKFYEYGFSHSPLHGICKMLNGKGVSVFNAEYRFARDASLSSLINPQDIAPLFIDRQFPITGSDIVQEFNEVATDVKAYKDGDKLRSYYNLQLDEIHANHEYLEEKFAFNKAFTDLLRNHSSEKKMKALLMALVTWDVRLLDMRVVHEIINSHVKKIAVLMGAAHVYNIALILEKLLGYKQASVIGEQKCFEYPVVNFNMLVEHDSFNQFSPSKKSVAPLNLDGLSIFNS